MKIAVNINGPHPWDTMESQTAWRIIGANLEKLVPGMLTVPKGSSIDAFTDPSGSELVFSRPSGSANIKLCSVTAPDLESHYGIRPQGNAFVDGDGEVIPREQLAAYLVQYIKGARDGGAEWGWEFNTG
jgi:hypothetical protein